MVCGRASGADHVGRFPLEIYVPPVGWLLEDLLTRNGWGTQNWRRGRRRQSGGGGGGEVAPFLVRRGTAAEQVTCVWHRRRDGETAHRDVTEPTEGKRLQKT